MFSEIEFMANRDLCKSLGIKRLPAVHFYYGSHGKVEDFVCGPKKVKPNEAPGREEGRVG